MRILLVEDDVILGRSVKDGLYQHGYTVDWLKDGESAQFALQKESFDLLLLDLGLPIMLGTDLLKFIRKAGFKLPVIIISARETIQDKIEGLDSGADDFLSKPFEFTELCARIRACHRRATGHATMSLSAKHITLYPASHKVTAGGQVVPLPRREFALLQKLLENKGEVVSREKLMQSLYGWQTSVDSNALEVHIHKLRKKLRARCIRTIRGIGYMIDK